MRSLRHAPCVVLFVILADVAPAPFCGSRAPRPSGVAYLDVRAPECSCAPGTIEVYVDEQPSGTTSCGAAALSIRVTPGSHTVRANMDGRTWPAQSTSVASDGRANVALGCPAE